MSRTLANLATRLVRATTALTSPRQRYRSYARVIESLGHDAEAHIQTRYGELRLNRLRSAHCASAAERFFEDEPETLAWIDDFAEGEVFLDIGASIGVFSLYAAQRSGLNVIAVEPNGLSFGLLVEHIALNNLGHQVTPLCIALGAQSQMATLNLNQVVAGAGGSSLDDDYYRHHSNQPGFSQQITCYALDDLFDRFGLPQPHHVKVDVDGLEPAIITGGEGILGACKSIMMEVEHRADDEIDKTIVTPLKQLGFSEDTAIRRNGTGRNRLYRKSGSTPT